MLREAQGDETSPFASALEITTRHTHSDSFDALLERLLSKRQILKDAIAAHDSIEDISQALRAEFAIDPQHSVETLRMELLRFDRAAIERIIPVLSGSLATNQKTAGHLSALLKENDSVQVESLIRRIYYTSDGEKPKKLASVITEKLLKDNPWIRDWLSAGRWRVASP